MLRDGLRPREQRLSNWKVTFTSTCYIRTVHLSLADSVTDYYISDLPDFLMKSEKMIKPSQVETFPHDFVESIAEHILNRTKHRPRLGIVCGTGLGGLGDAVKDPEVLPYSSIPNFPRSTVPGHAGNLIFGTLSGKSVVLMQGRFHLYEGYTPQQCTIPVRVMKLLGVETIFLTNASGGLNKKFKVGDIMILRDHICLPNLSGLNPLSGPNDSKFGQRFVALSEAYDSNLIKLAKSCAESLGYSKYIHEGVYTMQCGPSFETVAECRMLSNLGGDTVGMSTCPEVVVARHCSMRVFAMSLITNMVILEYDMKDIANHEEVLEAGKMSGPMVQAIVEEMIRQID